MIRLSSPAVQRIPSIALLAILPILAVEAFAQVPFRELPVEKIEKPRGRAKNDTPRFKAPVNQPSSTSQLAVLLDPIVRGRVLIRDATGKIIQQQEANADGQAYFSLPRGQTFQIEATYPGYRGEAIESKLSKSQVIVPFKLTAQSRSLRLPALPSEARVWIDETPVIVASIAGVPTIEDIPDGRHALTIRHPDYSDYSATIDFSSISVGESSMVFITLEKVARVTVHSLPGASVFLDGELKGQIQTDGALRFEVPATESIERAIMVEMLGYQPNTVRTKLAPGENSVAAKLDPVVTSDGTSDFFDDLTQWQAPESWRILRDPNNRRLRIEGPKLGWVRGKVYRDLLVNFALWLPDGNGATWAIRTDATEQTYYLFHLAGPKSTTHIPNRFYTYIVRRGGAPEQMDTPTPILVAPDERTSWTIEISIRGYKIEHTITSNETGERVTMGSFTDSTLTRDERIFGSFGFLSLAGEAFIVDDLHLDPIKEIAGRQREHGKRGNEDAEIAERKQGLFIFP